MKTLVVTSLWLVLTLSVDVSHLGKWWELRRAEEVLQEQDVSKLRGRTMR